MQKGMQLTKQDIHKYRKEIDEINLNDKDRILTESVLKITKLFENKKLDQFQLVLVQEINGLYNILKNMPNLEEVVQQKIIFALKYFLKSQDDIPDEIPGIGYLDDLAVVDWVIQDIKEQYSHYFQA
ncbi:MAG: DUF1232 domain-containing protein [Candidatus Marinimicrobia bacterium]|jgi:uncharacterized membrane protein YkvA (DUF1232 family)|nr:DUF1232 domain-containing protein [Candidatus Neomarinimicrobiota bacterium]